MAWLSQILGFAEWSPKSLLEVRFLGPPLQQTSQIQAKCPICAAEMLSEALRDEWFVGLTGEAKAGKTHMLAAVARTSRRAGCQTARLYLAKTPADEEGAEWIDAYRHWQG